MQTKNEAFEVVKAEIDKALAKVRQEGWDGDFSGRKAGETIEIENAVIEYGRSCVIEQLKAKA